MKIKTKGFTLIELLVVVAIISLLSSVVLAALKDVRTKAQQKAYREEIGQFINALELYKNDYGMYPGEGQVQYSYTAGTEFAPSTTENAENFETLLRPYMQALPKPKIKGSSEVFSYMVLGDAFEEGSPTDPVYARCFGDEGRPPYVILVNTDYPGFEDWPGWGLVAGQNNTEWYCFSLK
jgi:prepilin-type N-terminal cleavage/methylation domain-containing protein